MSSMIHFFPFVAQTKANIEHQNKFLSKISLTGKINANMHSANLFEYTDNTILKFDRLKEALIEAMVSENYAKVKGELLQKAQMAIDILNRNLFERTADVGFLATDGEIIQFLTDKNPNREKIEARLRDYVSKYSVYDDVLLFDTNKQLKANINPQNHLTSSQDKILQEALESEEYIEFYGYSDIFSSRDKCHLFAQKIMHHHTCVGVLVLSFKFQDELEEIFDSLSLKDEMIILEDNTGIIASSMQSLAKNETRIIYTKQEDALLFKSNKLAIQTKAKGYQGYHGLPWSSTAVALKLDTSTPALENRLQLPASLQEVIDEAYETVDDLSDVIINGELTASKYREYTLSPILDNLRNISDELVENITKAATSLVDIKTASLLNSCHLATAFAMDVMDRNLYERANDCRWWALTPQFIQELGKESPDTDALHQTLSYINGLYTVYTNILLYDKTGTIIATSQDSALIGTKLSGTALSQALQNNDTQRYSVSDFVATPLYHDKPTYLYHASVIKDDRAIGGIAVVFDSEPEFKAILDDSSLEEVKGFSLFCDTSRKIIASNNPKLPTLSTLDLPESYFQAGSSFQDFITYHDKPYLVTIVPSKGYREYKREDGYKNDLFAVSFVEI